MRRLTAAPLIAAFAALALASCSSSSPDASASPEPTASPSSPVAALDSNTPVDEQLGLAVRAGNTELAALAIDAGADVNALDPSQNFNVPLSIAITRDDLAMVELLLDAGAQIEYPEFPWTELTTAATYAGAEVIQALLDAGANPDGLDGFVERPLSAAAYEGNIAAMTTLLEAGAYVDAESSFEEGFSFTPLLSAGYGGSQDAAELLLQWGADPAWEAQDGTTAGDWAIAQGHHDLGLYLNELAGK